VSTEISEEHIASIFRVEEINSARSQQASKWQAECFSDPEDEVDRFLRNVG
jgi:hypothetical protein